MKIILLPAIIFGVTHKGYSMNESNNKNGLLKGFEIVNNDNITDNNFPNNNVSKFFMKDNPFDLTKNEMNTVHNISQKIDKQIQFII